MKAYEQNMIYYWGTIVPKSTEWGINPWECVRYRGHTMTNHPNLKCETDDYTFALTVLEGKPVWEGDEIYSKETGMKIKVMAHHAERYLRWESMTWTPPTKKRTFMLELTEEKLALLIKIPIDQRLFDDPLMFELLKDLQDLNATRSNQNANSVFRQSEQ